MGNSGHYLKKNSQSIDWSGEEQFILNCNQNEPTEDVISGTLKNDGTATWDIVEMTDHNAC